MSSQHSLFVALFLICFFGRDGATADEPRTSRRKDQSALKAYLGLVGQWKGTGQPLRSSTRGAWRETADWAWKLSTDSAALEMKVEKGKYLKSVRLRPGETPGSFVLDAILTDDSKRTFHGKTGARDVLVLLADGPAQAGLRRITLTPLHDTRFLMLLESQDALSGVYVRLGEIGYTRQGVAFAAGDSYPVCVVTEGRGTIPVTYKGKTYYVCCSGCKELFDENPAAVIAEAADRQKKAKAK